MHLGIEFNQVSVAEMIANTSGVLIRTMLFLVQNNHVMADKRIDTNTLYHIKTGESKYMYTGTRVACIMVSVCVCVEVKHREGYSEGFFGAIFSLRSVCRWCELMVNGTGRKRLCLSGSFYRYQKAVVLYDIVTMYLSLQFVQFCLLWNRGPTQTRRRPPTHQERGHTHQDSHA